MASFHKILLYALLAVLPCGLSAQSFSSYAYSPSDSIFPNPERGFYKFTSRGNAQGALSPATLAGIRGNGFSLVFRIYYLSDYVESPIADEYLDRIRQDFQAIRQAGLKVVLRFAYTQRSSKPYGDAEPARVLQHIQQLKPILRENADVIATLQAGFVGAWGEWYYTDHYSTSNPGNVTPEDQQERRELIEALLDAMPSERMVEVRYVGYKKAIFGDEPITPAEAFGNHPKSRVGHHNDCFVSSSNDVGTFKTEADRAYLAADSKYTSMGGETCGWYEPRSNCDTAMADMARYYWDYLNIDYFGETINAWKTDGCFEAMQRKMGYRYRLLEASIQDSSKAGGQFSLAIQLLNEGWSNPYNPRFAEIALRNVDNGAVYYFKLNDDLRRLPLGENIEFQIEAGLPEDMPEGRYEALLHLPDPAITIHDDPRFAIRLGNEGLWEEATGYHRLGHELVVHADASVGLYTGNQWFRNKADYAIAAAAPSIRNTTYSGQAILYWGQQQSDSLFHVLERSLDGGAGYEVLSLLAPGAFTFTDGTAPVGQPLHYRAYLTDGEGRSPYSNTITAETTDTLHRYSLIRADGLAGDWNAIPPVSTRQEDSLFVLRAYADTAFLNIQLAGAGLQGLELFIDADENANTGQSNTLWQTNGMDARVSRDSIFRFEAGQWAFAGRMQGYYAGPEVVEMRLPFEWIGLQQQERLRFGAILQTAGGGVIHLPFAGMAPAAYRRTLPPIAPENFEVSFSEEQPATRRIIRWDACTGCDGYFLERSADGGLSFAVLAEPASGDSQYTDSGFPAGEEPFYRMYSYNFAGPSAYTASKKAEEPKEPEPYLRVGPNPAGAAIRVLIRLDEPAEAYLTLYNLSGQKLWSGSQALPAKEDVVVDIPTARMPNGVYVLSLEYGEQEYRYKVVLMN